MFRFKDGINVKQSTSTAIFQIIFELHKKAAVPFRGRRLLDNALNGLPSAADAAFLHEAIVVAGDQETFHLTEGIQADADDDQEAGASEELGDTRRDVHRVAQGHRQDRQNRQENGAGQRNLGHGVVQEIGGGLARLDAGNEPALLLQIIGNLDGIELVCNPEEREGQNHKPVDDHVGETAILQCPRNQPLSRWAGSEESSSGTTESHLQR